MTLIEVITSEAERIHPDLTIVDITYSMSNPDAYLIEALMSDGSLFVCNLSKQATTH